MPLDQHVDNLLKMMAAAGRPKVWESTPSAARKGFLALARVADVKDEPIGRTDDGALPGPGGPLRYRVYTPIEASANHSAGLLYFHGGGFVLGDLTSHEGLCRMLANAGGCRVVSVDYRLAPEHKFPAAVDDAWFATRWTREHAAEFGIDPDRLAVGGDSAGGTLAAVVCQLAKLAGGPKIALQLLFCPKTDATAETESMRDFAEGYFLETRAIDWFGEQYHPTRSGARDPRLSPLHFADVSGLPEMHVHTAEFDPLRDEGKAYADRLARAGVLVRYTCHSGMIHHFYALAGVIPYARTAVREAGVALKQSLGN